MTSGKSGGPPDRLELVAGVERAGLELAEVATRNASSDIRSACLSCSSKRRSLTPWIRSGSTHASGLAPAAHRTLKDRS